MPKIAADIAVRLRVHGTSALLLGDAAALSELARDFAYFSDDAPSGRPDVAIRLHAAPAPAALPRRGWRWPGKGLTVRGQDGERLIRYDGGELVLWSAERGEGDIWCPDPHRLHELAYLLLLSRLGERLDLAGLHRVHALGFEYRGGGGLVLLPSGGGKTSLSLALRGAPDLSFLSDDTPLLAPDNRLLPFPLRWGLRSAQDLAGVPSGSARPFQRRDHGLKWLVDVEHFAGQLGSGAPARWILLGRRSAGAAAKITGAPFSLALEALALNLVIGWGVPQMAEYALSARSAPRWTAITLQRSAAALRLARAASCHRFELGESPRQAADALMKFLTSGD